MRATFSRLSSNVLFWIFTLMCAFKSIGVLVFARDTYRLPIEPDFSTTPINVTVISGNTAVLPCSVTYLGDHKVAWLNERSTIISLEDRRLIDDLRMSVERPFVKDWNLHIRKVRTNDSGIYKCQVNTKPVKIRHIHLRIFAPPTIIDDRSSDDMMVKEGETVQLVCNVTGTPTPTVQWFRRRIHEDNVGKERIGIEGEVLLIHNITRYCDDEYECMASNRVQHSANRIIKVAVEIPPEVTVTNRRIGQQIGKETILECHITAYPQSVSVWEKDGKEITNSWKYRTDVYNEMYNTITLSLRIRYIDEDDFGEYTCIASNTIGEDRETMILYQYIPPRVIETTTTTTSPTYKTFTPYATTKNNINGYGQDAGESHRSKIKVYTHRPKYNGGHRNHNSNHISTFNGQKLGSSKSQGYPMGAVGSPYSDSSKNENNGSNVTSVSVATVIMVQLLSYYLTISNCFV